MKKRMAWKYSCTSSNFDNHKKVDEKLVTLKLNMKNLLNV